MIKRYIITGAPGTGKTTLIDQLKKEGYPCTDEISRKIILQQQLSNGDKTPWQDMSGFVATVADHIIRELQQPVPPYTFTDRGLPDCMAYLATQCLEIPEVLVHFKYHNYYHEKVFMLPPWEAIYTTDPQRPQSFKETLHIHEKLFDMYNALNFKVVIVPKTFISIRSRYIVLGI